MRRSSQFAQFLGCRYVVVVAFRVAGVIFG
jgi:hypothetical protein